MIIRDEQAADEHAVRGVVHDAFGRAGEAVLVDRLRADGDSVISLVAVDRDAIIGHVMLSRLGAPFKALGLAPVSVRADRKRQGVGSALIRGALDRARQGAWDAVFVLGDPAFYGRFGFDADAARGFGSPYAGPHFMVHVVGGALAVTGKLDYPPAFAMLD
jgi:putative acetyltransferase